VESCPLAVIFCVFGLLSVFLIPIVSFSQTSTTAPSSTSEVNGRYTSPNGEVEMSLPADWKSTEVTSIAGAVVASAPSDFSIETLNELDAVMYLIIYEKALVNRAPGTIPPFVTSNADCTIQLDGSTIVSNAVAKSSTYRCSLANKDVIVRSVLAQTPDRWVSVMYVADVSTQDSLAPIFNRALRTILIRDVIDMDVGSNAVHTLKTLSVNGSNVFVQVRSSSNITDFTFDEERMELSFSVDGPIGTQGATDISIGKVLEGPYSVMINDEIISDYELIEGSTREENRIIVTYMHDKEKISITGTRAVPEFPVELLTLSAPALVLAVIMIGKYTTRRYSLQPNNDSL
jgi:hypothetical protein